MGIGAIRRQDNASVRKESEERGNFFYFFHKISVFSEGYTNFQMRKWLRAGILRIRMRGEMRELPGEQMRPYFGSLFGVSRRKVSVLFIKKIRFVFFGFSIFKIIFQKFARSRFGDQCEQNCPKNFYGKSCKEKCECGENQSCDPKTGTCLSCEPGYKGENCEESKLTEDISSSFLMIIIS